MLKNERNRSLGLYGEYDSEALRKLIRMAKTHIVEGGIKGVPDGSFCDFDVAFWEMLVELAAWSSDKTTVKEGGELCDDKKTAEMLRNEINRDAEFEFMVHFIKDNCFNNDPRNCNWLRMLWTTFCLHHDLCVDTAGYDHSIWALWGYVTENVDCNPHWKSYDNFDGFMCKHLV